DVPVGTDATNLVVKSDDGDGNATTQDITVAKTPDLTTNDLKNTDGTTTVAGTTTPGSTVTVTDGDKSYTATVDDKGNYTVDVPVGTDGGSLTVKTTDADGNITSKDVTADPTPALTTAPIVNANGNVTVAGTTDAGNTVTVTDAAGKVYP